MFTFTRSKLKTIITFIMYVTFLTGCELEQEAKDDINEQLTPPSAEEDTGTEGPIDTKLCESERFIQPRAEFTNKLDLLFVIDTSGSLYQELGSIADGIDAFIQEIPSHIDYQIGVILAHGSTSSHSGVLYSKKSHIPKVLKSTDLSQGEIRNLLKENMYKAASDYSTDGGEVGLYSLNQALTSKLQHNKDLGFFRDHTALAVVFVADENDICSLGSYPTGVEPVYDPNKKEPSAFHRDCSGITPEKTINNLKTVQKDQPLLVSGIIYTDPENQPDFGENEVGYGYLETIQLASGLTVDLADGDYEHGLSQIGSLAAKKLNLKTEFKLKLEQFNLKSLEVFVDRTPVDFTYHQEINEVHIPVDLAGQENSEVYISYCLPMVPLVQFSGLDPIPSRHAIDLAWNTDLPALGFVEITNVLTNEKQMLSSDPNYKWSHHILIDGLESNTLYSVRILGENTEGATSSTDPINIRTLP